MDTDPGEFGYSIVDDYEKAFQKHSRYNTAYADATLHLLVGQLPNIRNMRIYRASYSWLDPRIHPCFFSPSGSGKGAGSDFVARMATALGLKYQPVTTVTDAGLVGSIDNDKKPEYGWLHHSHGINILAATEGSVILQDRPPKESARVMDLLQITMNSLGSQDSTISKKIGFGEPIEFKPTASLFFTTYVPTNLTDIVLQRGLLQRMYVVVKTLSTDKRQQTINDLQKDFENPVDTLKEEAYIVQRLKHINDYYSGRTSLQISPDAGPGLNNAMGELFDMIRQTQPFLQEKLGEFVTRLFGHQIRIAHQFACMKMHDQIEKSDMELAYRFHTSQQFYELISFLERRIVVPREWTEMFNTVRNHISTSFASLAARNSYKDEETGFVWVDRLELQKEIAQKRRVMDRTAEIEIEQMKEWRLIEIRNHKTLQKDLVRLLGS